MRLSQWILPLALLGGIGLAADPQGCGVDTDNDLDGWTVGAGDCDDANPEINPAAIDGCDGVDNNCNGVVDDGFDQDGDGDATCTGDCDDTDPLVGPSSPEACNDGEARDDDCDGVVDEGLDGDGDGVRACDGDCDDADPAISPQAPELCTGGFIVDEDCDGAADEGFDQDGDGFTLCGGSGVASDCDDGDAGVNPLATETCDGRDEDCDGALDNGFDQDGDGFTTCGGDCDDADAGVSPAAVETCDGRDEDCDGAADNGFDADGDGFYTCDAQGEVDCDDAHASVHPGAPETCDALDNDCDGTQDEGFDQDGDGYFQCAHGGTAADCDDGLAAVHPGAAETCNDRDDDCDSVRDEGFDQDGDGYYQCAHGGLAVDCDDGVSAVHPGATETCNGRDDDCDSQRDEGFDQDGDGFTTCGGDCDDSRASVNPGAVEGPSVASTTTDGRDNDCDGYVDIDCDGTSGSADPRVVLTSPTRGKFTTSSTVSFSGLALPGQDMDPIVAVTAESASVSMTACSDDGGALFSGSRTVSRGLTTLRVTATDAAGATDKGETSVIYSSKFIPIRSQVVSGALIAELNQGTWNILGQYLESYLDADELEDELLGSNPIINDSGDADCIEEWWIKGNATAYTHQDVQITFTISGGKIHSTARLVRPEIWASGTAYYDLEWYCGGWDDHVGLDAYARFNDVVATADGSLSMNSDGTVRVSFSSVTANANGPYLDVDADSSIYDWLIDLFEDDLADEMEQFVEDELRAFVANDLGPLLSAELNDLNLAYDVDVLGVTYDVAFDIASVSVPTGTVDLGFSLDYDYPVDSRTPSNPGAIGQALNFGRSTSPTVAFKVGLDFFNSAFHAMWEGGSLYVEGPLSSNPPIYGEAMPLLPPVVVPGSSPYLMVLELGDVVSTVEIEDGHGGVQVLTAAMSARVPMDIDPVVDGYNIGFDANFGSVQLTFDVLSDVPLSGALVASMEEGLSEMLSIYLDELEVYVETLQISYLGLPVRFSSLTIAPDSANSAMLTISGTATYTGN